MHVRLIIFTAAALAGWLLNPESVDGARKALPEPRSWIALAGVLLMLAGPLIARSKLSTARRVWASQAAALVLIAWCGGVVGGVVGYDVERGVERYDARLWSYYHYYLGAKYFEELGYGGLYDQTVAVDREGARRFEEHKWLRNLTTYQKEPLALDRRVRGAQWSDERWEDFRADVQWFQGKREGPDGVSSPNASWRLKDRSWRRILKDRGYNATPTSGVLYQVIAIVPLSERNLMLIGMLDPLLLLVAFLVAVRTFGALRALPAAAWLLLFFGNEFHVVGGPLLHDYLVALILMACALHRNRPMMAGMAAAYAVMTRVFPVFFVGGFIVWALFRWQAERRIPRVADRFFRGLAAAGLVLLLLGCLTPRGPTAWVEWAENMSLHSEDHRYGNKRVGFQHVFTHDFSLDLSSWPKKSDRRDIWAQQETGWLVSTALLGILWLLAARRLGMTDRDPLEMTVLGLLVAFGIVVMSRYYWSAACLFFFIGGRERADLRTQAPGIGLMSLVAIFYFLEPSIDKDFGQYWLANVGLTLWGSGMMLHALLASSVDED